MPLLVDEDMSATMLGTHEADQDLVTWWGTGPECISALNRRRREGSLTHENVRHARELLDPLRESWSEMLPTDRTRDLAESLWKGTLSRQLMPCS